MTSLTTWLICAGLLFSTAGIADEAEAPDGTRVGKTYAASLDVGFSVMPLPSVGVTGGYFLRPDLVIEAAAARGLFGMYIFQVRSEVLELRAKKFWGDSFYTNAGLARRTIGIGFGPSGIIGTDVLDVEARISSLAVDLSLGNTWQWESWNFGVDWFGILWPIARLESTDDIPTSDLGHTADDHKHRILDRIAEGRSYSGFRMSVGYAF